MSAKLESAEDVLCWAYNVRQHEDELFAEDPPHAGDRATAAELARAMRLLRAFDREWEGYSYQGAHVTADMRKLLNVLARAAALEEPPTR